MSRYFRDLLHGNMAGVLIGYQAGIGNILLKPVSQLKGGDPCILLTPYDQSRNLDAV